MAATAAIGGAKAAFGVTKARTVPAAAASTAAATAIVTTSFAPQRRFLVLELTRRSGLKSSLDVPLPRVLNPAVSHVLERFPRLAY